MNKRLLTLSVIVLSAAAARVLPHPPNVTPIAAMALFGGAYLFSRKLAFLVPLSAMFLSDLGLWALGQVPLPGLQSVWVYASLSLTVCLGFLLRQHRRVLSIAGVTLSGALLFYLVTNFGVWWTNALYPRTMAGLLQCYTAAIPFFRNMLLGDACYVALLIGGFALAERRFLVLREPDSVGPKMFPRAV
ncbi:MAG TPA: DUF6580 family putative transport protein [Candidatus Udaeobacter sp.]|nr:DUF6580 family putative transport protein [Candidatus Udaeobacter sp.]